MQSKGNPYDSVPMRELGQNLIEHGFFELNLVSGSVEWVNTFTLGKYGMQLEQMQAMTIYDLIPSEHLDSLTSAVADETKGRPHKFSIWPGKTADGKLVWWYITKIKNAHPIHCYRAEYLNTTDKSGPGYASMLAIMSTANSYNELAAKLSEHQDWTQKEVAKINIAVDSLQDHLRGCLSAANRAANEAVEANQSITRMKSDMADQFAKQTTEILRLISTDTVHEERMATFETHMKKAAADAATSAIKEIAASAEKAGKAITVQANKAGQGLARKVTIPVGAIATAATIIQWIMNNWPHK